MIAHRPLRYKASFFLSAAAIKVDHRKLGFLSRKKYRESLREPVFIWDFDKNLSAGKLIDFGGPARLVKDIIEQLYTLICPQLIGVSTLRNKFMTVVTTGQEDRAV